MEATMANIKQQKLLYHLTSIENLEGIFRDGLKPRAALRDFIDVADHGILEKRRALGLDQYVPFHWFAANPFDGCVQRNRPASRFVQIAVLRSLARQNGWKVIPRHPLAHDDIQLLDYDEGLQAIEWDVMNTRDYHDPDCKSVCMAECLAPGIVVPKNFYMLFVPNADVEALCLERMRAAGVNVGVTVNQGMFLK
jgi:hypothetical protein